MLLSHRATNFFLVAGLLSSGLSALAFAGAPKDLSGSYVSEAARKGTQSTVVLTISQTESQIEIRRDEGGKSSVSTFPLDGSEGVYTTPTGIMSKGSAHWKGADLIIETLVEAPPRNGRTMRFHTIEDWQLSSDGKTLKVSVDTDSPDMHREITAAAIQPYTLVYRRNPTIQ
jgi:hypothetical protein